MKLFILFLVSVLLYHPCLANSVGYGSSDAVYSAKNQEFFYMGFLLGLDKGLDRGKRNEVLGQLKTAQIADGKHLSAVRSATKLVDEGVSVVSGFPTSHEALLAAKVARDKDRIFISAAAAHSDMATLGKNIFTLGESVTKSKKALIQFVSQKLPGKKGLLLSNERFVFSVNQASILKDVNLRMGNVLNLEEKPLSEDHQVSEEVLKSLKAGEYGYIIITTYADDSTKLLEQFVKSGVSVPIIANSSWTIGNIELVRRSLLKVKSPVFCVASVVKGLPTSKRFEAEYQEKYNKPPETEMYYGYDLGQVVAQAINRIPEKLTPESFAKAFRENLCFKDTTTGRVCFPAEGGHAVRNIYWLKFSKKSGFLPTNSQPRMGE